MHSVDGFRTSGRDATRRRNNVALCVCVFIVYTYLLFTPTVHIFFAHSPHLPTVCRVWSV